MKKKKSKYLNIQDWMIDDLHLKGNDLLAYALIYGFSQDDESVYNGSYAYVMYWLSVDERSAVRILKRLESIGLIKKWKVRVNGVLVNRWSAVTELPEKAPEKVPENPTNSIPQEGGQNVTHDKMSPLTKCQSEGWQNVSHGGDKMSPNNLLGKSIGKSIYQGEAQKMDGLERERDEISSRFREQLELDVLAHRYEPEKLDELLDNIVDMYSCRNQFQQIGQHLQTTQAIRKRLDSLTSQHIEYVLDSMQNTTQPIRNIMAYIRATLLNAPATMEHYYQAQANSVTARARGGGGQR